jgi:predicted transglutaminase-like cysteine proteinase
MSAEPTGVQTSQPIGHYDFCGLNPAECSIKSNDGPLHLTKPLWKKLIAVNNRVNTRIQPITDLDHFGKDEVWAYPNDGKGDCEDYVLEKRRELAAKGIPISDLLMTVVLQDTGDGHNVLTVRTDLGDFILDNLEGKIKLWSDTPYKYIKRQSSTNTGQWVSVNDSRGERIRAKLALAD